MREVTLVLALLISTLTGNTFAQYERSAFSTLPPSSSNTSTLASLVIQTSDRQPESPLRATHTAHALVFDPVGRSNHTTATNFSMDRARTRTAKPQFGNSTTATASKTPAYSAIHRPQAITTGLAFFTNGFPIIKSTLASNISYFRAATLTVSPTPESASGSTGSTSNAATTATSTDGASFGAVEGSLLGAGLFAAFGCVII